MLIIIGYLTINEFHLHSLERYSCGQYSTNKLLNIFGNYDTGWYMEIAKNWYPKLSDYPQGSTFAQYNFFPLYPALIYLVHFLTAQDFFIAGLLISNFCLIGSGILVYKIGEHLFNTEIAKIAMVFLYACPLSFLLSGAYSESLYLFLLLLSFFFAYKEKWMMTGIVGLLVTLSRPVGVFVFFPLLIIYLQNSTFTFSKIKKDIAYLLFIPLGVLILMIENNIYTGDYLTFIHNPHYAARLHSPISILIDGLTNNFFTYRFLAGFTVIYIITWAIFWKQVPLAFHLVILYSMAIPLCYGLMSMPRMLLVAFPFIFICAGISEKHKITQPLLISSCLLQGYLAVCWFLGFGNVI